MGRPKKIKVDSEEVPEEEIEEEMPDEEIDEDSENEEDIEPLPDEEQAIVEPIKAKSKGKKEQFEEEMPNLTYKEYKLQLQKQKAEIELELQKLEQENKESIFLEKAPAKLESIEQSIKDLDTKIKKVEDDFRLFLSR